MGHMLVQSTHTVRGSLDGTWRAALPLAKRGAQPVPACEWCETSGAGADEALERLLERGGFPEPFLAERPAHAERWRNPYLDGLIREDVLEFSRIHEIRAMRHFVDVLRERVGAPLSLASIARDLQISPITLAKYLDILEALYVVFAMRPFHRNVARAILKAPKVYFFRRRARSVFEGHARQERLRRDDALIQPAVRTRQIPHTLDLRGERKKAPGVHAANRPHPDALAHQKEAFRPRVPHRNWEVADEFFRAIGGGGMLHSRAHCLYPVSQARLLALDQKRLALRAGHFRLGEPLRRQNKTARGRRRRTAASPS